MPLMQAQIWLKRTALGYEIARHAFKSNNIRGY
jgi:hypothetical protein